MWSPWLSRQLVKNAGSLPCLDLAKSGPPSRAHKPPVNSNFYSILKPLDLDILLPLGSPVYVCVYKTQNDVITLEGKKHCLHTTKYYFIDYFSQGLFPPLMYMYINVYVYVCMLPMSVGVLCAWCLWRPDGSTKSPGTGIRAVCEPPWGYWESNPGPLKQHWLYLFSEPSL